MPETICYLHLIVTIYPSVIAKVTALRFKVTHIQSHLRFGELELATLQRSFRWSCVRLKSPPRQPMNQVTRVPKVTAFQSPPLLKTEQVKHEA